MRKLLIILTYILAGLAVNAQLIDNKFNIYVSSSLGKFIGGETIKENNYITPSLYSNYRNIFGFSIKGFRNFKENYGYGVNYEFLYGNDWNSTNYTDFDESKIHLHTITPFFRIHNKFRSNGPFNKLHLFIDCGPSVGFANLSLSKTLFEIQTEETNSNSPMLDNSFLTGIKGYAGVEYSFSQSLGLFISYSFSKDWVSSKFYNDKSIKSSLVHFGLVMKFSKNKYFYY